MTGAPDLVEAVARLIAKELEDDFDHAFASDKDWTAAGGRVGGRYRDVRAPLQVDYLAAARAVIPLVLQRGDALTVRARPGCGLSRFLMAARRAWLSSLEFCDDRHWDLYHIIEDDWQALIDLVEEQEQRRSAA